ncbi:MAG: lysophospholipid acyltransferase family protein [Bdellovibrionales bacterium]|nr:lysophospholipid acyltransferase family protein [Bdellovibrionales bacterium]
MRWIFAPLSLFASILVKTPWSFQKRLGAVLGVIWFDVLRIRRQVILSNLAIAYPQLSYKERVSMGRRAMKEFGCNLVEYCEWSQLSQTTLQRKFAFHDLKYFDHALAKGKGALLLTLHLGNGDLAIAGLALKGYKINLVSKVFKTQWLNQKWFAMREKIGIKLIPPRNSSYAILKALKRNEIVVFVLDQYTGPPIGVETEFFGRKTGTGFGLAVIAERSGASVIPGYTFRDQNGINNLYLQDEIPYEISSEENANPRVNDAVNMKDISFGERSTVRHMTQIYNDKLESYVRKHPEQWMWLHKRWKQFG